MMMENYSGLGKEDDHIELPAGFRFHPTDEELITQYLVKKVLDNTFSPIAMGEVDMNRIEPWELPGLAKMGGKEWYFFSLRDKKYPTGLRTNRATEAGYWKATGKDKEIFRGKSLVGMKKTLVFYKGRAPNGGKTNWVIHEFRLEGKYSAQILSKSAKSEWVISRVFHKSSGEKKETIPVATRANSDGNELQASRDTMIESDSLYVPCFSDPVNIQAGQNNFLNNPSYPFVSNSDVSQTFPAGQSAPVVRDNYQIQSQLQFQFSPDYKCSGQNQSILKGLVENDGFQMKREIGAGSQETARISDMNTEVMSNLEMGKMAFEDEEAPLTSVGAIDMDCFWSCCVGIDN